MGKKYKISENRILQISNDISENMNFENHSKKELYEVIKFFRDAHQDLWNAQSSKSLGASVKIFEIGQELLRPVRMPYRSKGKVRVSLRRLLRLKIK